MPGETHRQDVSCEPPVSELAAANKKNAMSHFGWKGTRYKQGDQVVYELVVTEKAAPVPAWTAGPIPRHGAVGWG